MHIGNSMYDVMQTQNNMGSDRASKLLKIQGMHVAWREEQNP